MSRPARFLITLVLLITCLAATVDPLEAGRDTPPISVFVDTDIGVDDAVAIAWLLREPNANLVGFSTVFGNTSVENATRNLLTLLGAAGVNEPVTIGAAAPLELPRTRTGAFIHGPDGLWFAQQPVDLSGLPTDAPAAMAAAARANPGLTIIALGPLTNVARAVEQYPADMAGVHLIALGGGKKGNITPVAEFNIYADPHALDVVLAGPLKVELVTLDAFEQVRVDTARLTSSLNARGDNLSRLLAGILPFYTQASTGGAGTEVALADTAAVVYALRSDLGTPVSALVRVITDNGYVRGQTVIADTVGGRVPLIADDAELSGLADQLFVPGFDINAAIGSILARQPDNATVVLEVKGARMSRVLVRGLTR